MISTSYRAEYNMPGTLGGATHRETAQSYLKRHRLEGRSGGVGPAKDHVSDGHVALSLVVQLQH